MASSNRKQVTKTTECLPAVAMNWVDQRVFYVGNFGLYPLQSLSTNIVDKSAAIMSFRIFYTRSSAQSSTRAKSNRPVVSTVVPWNVRVRLAPAMVSAGGQ